MCRNRTCKFVTKISCFPRCICQRFALFLRVFYPLYFLLRRISPSRILFVEYLRLLYFLRGAEYFRRIYCYSVVYYSVEYFRRVFPSHIIRRVFRRCIIRRYYWLRPNSNTIFVRFTWLEKTYLGFQTHTWVYLAIQIKNRNLILFVVEHG